MGVSSQEKFLNALRDSLHNHRFIRFNLGHYKGTEKDLQKAIVRNVVLKNTPHLSITWRYKTRDIVKNQTIDDGISLIASLLGKDFWQAQLCTTEFDMTYDLHAAGKEPKVKKLPPSTTEIPDQAHDRAKKRMIDSATAPWMQALGLTDGNGVVLKTAQDKFRQIQRYVELVAPLLHDWPRDKPIAISDMGAGKGYLTFALYDYLTRMGLNAAMTGVEMRPDLVAACNRVAQQSGFDGLQFIEGTIDDYRPAAMDMLIALHACNTATDDAIANGIRTGTSVIVVAPCCHKQIRQEMEAKDNSMIPAIRDLTRSGILMERQAEMVTDHLRALILEYYGYQTKVFEFISDAHTPKNVMITAEHKKGKIKNPAIAARIADIKQTFGIREHYLERLCPVDT